MAHISFIRASKLVDLVKEADARHEMHVRLIGANRLALGVDPLRPTHIIDLSNERVGPYDSSDSAGIPEVPFSPFTVEPQQKSDNVKIMRRSGDYWFEINGSREECMSLKELLSGGLRALEQARPGTLEKLSNIKLRTRRIVARDRNELFDRAHLTKEYSEKLTDGWWFGTNNSANETNAWLRRACSCAGLKWGEKFKTSLGTRV